jgi:hypothetical protein
MVPNFGFDQCFDFDPISPVQKIVGSINIIMIITTITNTFTKSLLLSSCHEPYLTPSMDNRRGYFYHHYIEQWDEP